MEGKMEENKATLLTDDNGSPSTMRVMSWCSFVACIVAAGLIFFKPPTDPFTGLYIFTAFLIGAFIPKSLQKFAETNPLRK